MPTAARMISAICLAALAWVVSEQIKTLFEEDKIFGFFNMINLVLGFVIGWQVIGSRAGRGYSAAINNGLTGGVVLVFWGLFSHSGERMIELSMRNRYDGAFDAVAGMFQIMWDNAILIATPVIALMLIVGSAVSGLIAELMSKRAS
jgi:hypothetical protein